MGQKPQIKCERSKKMNSNEKNAQMGKNEATEEMPLASINKALDGGCTKCGKATPIEELRLLPEVEDALRKYALETMAVGEVSSLNLPKDVDYKTVLCPDCYKKYIEQQDKGK